MKRWFAITRRRGGTQEFYSVQWGGWWVNAGEGTQFPDQKAAAEAIILAGLNPLQVGIDIVQEELEETGPDAADWWK